MEVEKIVEKPVVVEKVVEKPVIVEKVVEKPVAQETPAARCEITLSTNRLQFKVLKCTGNATQQRITILAEMTNVTQVVIRMSSCDLLPPLRTVVRNARTSRYRNGGMD